MRTPSSVMSYLANPCVRTVLQVRLVWCLVGIRRREHEATNETKSREKQFRIDGSFESVDRQGRFCDSVGKKKRRNLLCEIRGGSHPHSGARRMCKDNQAEVNEA